MENFDIIYFLFFAVVIWGYINITSKQKKERDKKNPDNIWKELLNDRIRGMKK